MNGRVILALVGLRLRRLLSDRMALVWFLGMPLVFSFIMGQLLGDWGGSGAASRPRCLVYDGDGGPRVEQLLLDLRDHEKFILVTPDTTADRATARALVESGRYTAAILVPPGFTAAVDAGDTTSLHLVMNGDRASSQTVHTLLDRAVLKLNTAWAAEGLVADPSEGPLPRDRARAFDATRFDNLWDAPRLTVEAATLGRLPEDEDLALTSSYQHVGPAYTLFFVLMFTLLGATELVTARRDGTLARLIASRATSTDIVLGHLGGGLVQGLAQAGLLLGINGLVFGIDYGDSTVTLVLVLTLFAGACAAGAVLLGCLARTSAQTDGLSIALTMVLAALGGLWWPLEIVPPFMQAVGRALPTGQAITVLHDLVGRGWGLAQCADLLVGLAVWCAVLTALAVWRLRRLVAV